MKDAIGVGVLDDQAISERTPIDSGTPVSPEPTLDARIGSVAVRPEPVMVQPLQRIGHFILLSELGRGGMGAVFAAYDEHLDRKAAIKLLHTGHRPGEVQRHQLLREAKAMARISHPNVVSVYEVGEADGQVFIAMEFIDGMTLSQWQRQPGRTWQELLSMYLQAGAGLAAAHATGLVHRDFKPDNVLISRFGRAQVLDFGLARLGERLPDPTDSIQTASPRSDFPDKLTVDGMISGTPGYMSPEQYCSQPVDARADQFSFCAALFGALVGRPPFAGQNAAEIAGNTIGGRAAPFPKDSPVPEEIQHALLRGLSSNPEQRFPRMEELLEALALEITDSLAAAGVSRQRFVRWALLVGMVLTAAAQVARARYPLTYRQILPVSVLMIAVVLGVGLAQRQRLLRNSQHRGMWLLMLIPIVQNFGQRLIAWHLGLQYQQLIPIELLALTGAAALGGVFVSRSMFWMAGLLGASSAAMTMVGQPAALYVSPVYSMTLFWMLWEWTTLAVPKRRTGRSSGSGKTCATEELPRRSCASSNPSARAGASSTADDAKVAC